MSRKPANGIYAKTPAQRKQDQRDNDKTAIYEIPSEQWNERQCLLVLSSPQWNTPNNPLLKAAWIQLGKLKNIV